MNVLFVDTCIQYIAYTKISIPTASSREEHIIVFIIIIQNQTNMKLLLVTTFSSIFYSFHVGGFTISPYDQSRAAAKSTTCLSMERFSLSLSKPLGLILEEDEDAGVIVKEVSEEGSAAGHAKEVLNCKLGKVQETDVSEMDFDSVMDCIVGSSDPVAIEFIKELAIGTPAILSVDGKEIEAKVGDNLRKTLLDAGVEVYTGMQKLSNCGGAGQCTHCAMDVDGDWSVRSDYENQKLKKYPNARLSCLNSIQGPATIQKTKK